MIGKILETLYSKVFINIIVLDTSSVVYIEVCSKDEVIDSDSSTFKTTGINSEMFEYIREYIKLSPFYYVSILDKSTAQGALPTCDKNEMSRYIDTSSVIQTICKSNRWSSYTYENDIKDIKYEYKSVGLDFIFSPFDLLTNFFKDKIDNHLAIFLLIEDRNISLSVFDNSSLLYAEYLDMKKESESDPELIDSSLEDDLLLEIDAVDLEDIDVDIDMDMDDDDSLEDFSDIEDLDSGEDIEEFSEAKDIEEIVEHEDSEELDEGLNEDYHRFTLIQDSINSFYKDDKYESEFLETVYIADGIGVSSDLKKYLEEEMFLSVVVRKIDLAEELSRMAKMEQR